MSTDGNVWSCTVILALFLAIHFGAEAWTSQAFARARRGQRGRVRKARSLWWRRMHAIERPLSPLRTNLASDFLSSDAELTLRVSNK